MPVLSPFDPAAKGARGHGHLPQKVAGKGFGAVISHLKTDLMDGLAGAQQFLAGTVYPHIVEKILKIFLYLAQ